MAPIQLTLFALLFALAAAGADAHDTKNNNEKQSPLEVSAVWVGEESIGAALRALAGGALRGAGVEALGAAAPAECAPPRAADAPACLRAALGALASGRLHAALLPVPAAAAPSAALLRDVGLEELGDVAPPTRRACLPTLPVGPRPAVDRLRSLLDLADPARAARYMSPSISMTHFPTRNITYQPEWCHLNVSCVPILTSDESEAQVYASVVRWHRLYATVTALRLGLNSEFNKYPSVVCMWAPELTTTGPLRSVTALGPPPCVPNEPCPFETRRMIKYVNVMSFARTPRAFRAMIGLTLTSEELRELANRATEVDPGTAATEFLSSHPNTARVGEVRVAVLLPNDTKREAYDGAALAAAAMLAEEHLERERVPRAARFKVEIYDDACNAVRAYKYLMDALGTGEYGSLSAVVGPACGAAFADVARQGPAHTLPVVAYSPQVAPRSSRTVLAAGSSGARSAALMALATTLGWRRAAALSEPATRSLLDAARLQLDLVHHLELPDTADVEYDLLTQWAQRVVAANGRVVYVCLEDARLLRAAVCAARAAGLTPAAGAVWLLPAALPAAALRPAPADPGGCTRAQLLETLEGHLFVEADWVHTWERNRSAPAERWRGEWREFCPRTGGAACGRTAPGAPAALLYDALRLWAGALDAALTRSPAALDDLHERTLVESIVRDVMRTGYVGLTGRFEWSDEEGTPVRDTPLTVSQWRGGAAHAVGRWSRGALTLEAAALRWVTADGRVPGDGGDRCALHALAVALGAGCGGAYAAAACGTLALAAAALAATALYCRRRVEREYRARLSALGLRALPPEVPDLARWEVPRERVVINRKLGMGAFGTVYGGHALLAEDRGWCAVAVKTLKPGATTEEKLDFLSEAEAMKRFDHKNVVRLLGVVTKTEPVCTVMELMLYGDLKSYLLGRRHLAGSEEAAEEVSARRLTGMALDAARALSYLAQLRYVHRDVAARNCLLSASRVVKLADFGMTRLVFENDYYRFSRKGMLPVRWMAPESLISGVFSSASDVWSFGVLLYEIVTFGALPFQGLSNSEVLEHVKAGYTIDLPKGIKPRLEGLMKSCWQQESKCRPTAAEVAAFLAEWPRVVAPCPDAPLDALPLPAPAAVACACARTCTTSLSADDAADAADTDAFLAPPPSSPSALL